MARTHRMLSQTDWSGLDLSTIVQAELEPFGDRVSITGVDIVLAPDQVQNFSLALHELATNAAKYGALSVPEGHVDVSWAVAARDDQPLLQLKWQERGGPTVAPPSREGFGSSLLRSIFSGSRLDFAPKGLSYRIDVPLRRVAA